MVPFSPFRHFHQTIASTFGVLPAFSTASDTNQNNSLQKRPTMTRRTTLITMSCQPSMSSLSENGLMTKTAPAPTTLEERAATALHWSAQNRSRPSTGRKSRKRYKDEDSCLHLIYSHLWTSRSNRSGTGRTERGATPTSAVPTLRAPAESMKWITAVEHTAQAPLRPRLQSSGCLNDYYANNVWLKLAKMVGVFKNILVVCLCIYQIFEQRGGVGIQKGSDG